MLYTTGVEGVSSGDELDSDEDDDLSPENDGFMGSNGIQGADGSIAGASGSGSGGQNVRANVVGKRRPNGPAVNRYFRNSRVKVILMKSILLFKYVVQSQFIILNV